ncbi:LacI family DNA-binding transcriptional regulator [Vibrio aestuarianus]|uniref:LacI family transcriptional regulator n=1 Tax=Vibrio aestuarianus TaxID=28171 RepID=A0A9X4FB59_9VIBR|nr:LacI family DNA-binding transcriptional regulator [Vibrio aestuarianus]MDE1236015.1 LacI family transcriptional regulator [Vibrio aestuarianus]MDE1246893.1 LacI family transcriptional regulator [Vibrio aestuarianus]MDE1315149.1 LacI family transcriptional regulator [Vibrio aestuarianus]MDE1347494.1 LacI family transcriptional regulator [Vibrio aestuarianus]NGZ64237.1 LacI family transcriptional regulator [Vibrio aestuarianus subsp. cardii]
MPKVSIKNVAESAGVSIATVSQVLQNKGRISEKTREKVKKTLDELGYVYNQNAANLRSRRSNQIGLIVHDISNPFYGEMAASMSRVIDSKDNMLFLSNTEGDVKKQERLTKALIENGAAGIVICASNETEYSYFEYLKKCRSQIVLVTRHEDKGLSFVGTDNVLGGEMATKHLIELGHKNIAFIGGLYGTTNRDNRVRGYKRALAEACIEYDNTLNISCETSKEAGKVEIRKILQDRPDVTACVFYQDIIAHGAIDYLRENNVDIGQNMSIVGLDGTEASMNMTPQLTTVSFSATDMGKKAAALLFDGIDGNQGIVKIIIQPKLIIGETTHRI